MENKTTKYFKYAIGEIVLVVIGILIALQINNWNNHKKDRKLEKQYLFGLINDLKTDSTAIDIIKKMSDEQVRQKVKLYEYFEGHTFPSDSIANFFSKQWGMPVGFNPNTTMLDEMKSTGGIHVIQNPEIRKKIIAIYNLYQDFINGSQAYYELNRFELRKMAFKIPNVFDVESLGNHSKPDIVEALKNHELRNAVMANYAISVNKEISVLQQENHELIKILNDYFSKL